MRTRKRSLAAANASHGSAAVTRKGSPGHQRAPRLDQLLVKSHAQLRHHGFARITPSEDTQGTFNIAASAFQAQLALLDKQPAQTRHAGFKRLARNQRLEVRHGDDNIGQLGILQHVAIDVGACI